MLTTERDSGHARSGRIRILGISGSGRKQSYNTALLRAAKELLPAGARLDTYDVSGFPLYNEDVENDPSPEIRDFKAKIRMADAVLFAAPEYNYSISATLKNAIEWGNRPDNSWDGKPSAIISASSSSRGGARVQLHLRQIMIDLNMHPINEPQLLVARAEEKFDDGPTLKDERSRELLRSLLVALVEWAVRLGSPTLATEPP